MPSETNPVVARLWRGDSVESMHRGAWALVDVDGRVVDGRGDPDQLVYARSSTKSVQALALLESGAADRFDVSPTEIAVAISSHNGEPTHVQAAASILRRAGLDEASLRCGPQRPAGSGHDAPASRITNNCSGKHAGFLAAAVAFGEDPATYLAPESKVQRHVHQAMLELSGAQPSDLSTAIDGCSAPTFRLPLRALATALARVANPECLADRAHSLRRIADAAAAHPEMVGGTAVPHFDTDLIRATSGRLFSKGGAKGVQTIGICGSGLGFVAKIDDGSTRSLYRLALLALAQRDQVSPTELEALERWHDPVRHNRDGLVIGKHEVPANVVATSPSS